MRRHWRQNADAAMSKGLRIFFSGGAAELDGEQLSRIRDAANEALLAHRHIPMRGGPVAPHGWIWVKLEDAKSVVTDEVDISAYEFREEVEGRGDGPQGYLGDAEQWGLAGNVQTWFIDWQEDLGGLQGAYLDFEVYYLVRRDLNWNRRGVYVE
jgi:hypothetical protein